MRKPAILMLGVIALLAAPALADVELVKTTYAYKTVGDLRIEADVYRADGAAPRPAVVWIHGGALLFGGKADVLRPLVKLCREENYVLVSLDYRLAPEAKLPAIIEDVQDAFRWLHAQGPKLGIDADKIAIAGGSAGGYLTLMTGWCVEPRPRALVSYWGYGDVDGDWLTKPWPPFRAKSPLRTKDEAYRTVGRVLTNTDGDPAAQKGRVLLFQYLRQQGLWCKEVTGLDPDADRGKLDKLCPVRNVTAAYPPTLLIHGTADNDVPVRESEQMAAELARRKVPHELIVLPGAGHGLGGGDQEKVAAAHERARAFVRERLK